MAEKSAKQLAAQAQAKEAASLAATTGMTLKEAWAQVKKSGISTSSPSASMASDAEARGKKILAQFDKEAF